MDFGITSIDVGLLLVIKLQNGSFSLLFLTSEPLNLEPLNLQATIA